jgi:hypothetical protein
MELNMSYAEYMFMPKGANSLAILHVATYTEVGYVEVCGANYHVKNDNSEKIAVLKSLEDILPVFLDYSEKRPARWDGDASTCYRINAHFGDAEVKRDQSGSWVAHRNEFYPLLRGSEPARFSTAEEARCAVDVHLRDGLPNSTKVNDGLSWERDPLLEFWSQP